MIRIITRSFELKCCVEGEIYLNIFAEFTHYSDTFIYIYRQPTKVMFSVVCVTGGLHMIISQDVLDLTVQRPLAAAP